MLFSACFAMHAFVIKVILKSSFILPRLDQIFPRSTYCTWESFTRLGRHTAKASKASPQPWVQTAAITLIIIIVDAVICVNER